MVDYPSRRSPRLKDYDYRQYGAYFVTICIHERKCILGAIKDGEMELSVPGKIVLEEWERIVLHRPTVELDGFVVMPNHVHGIVVLRGDTLETVKTDRASPVPTKTKSPAGSLSAVVGGYKSAVTRRINMLRQTPGAVGWQSRFHDHIIRNESDLNRIREYVLYNPVRWEQDIFYSVDS